MIRTKGQKIFNITNICFMIIISAAFLIPYWLILSASLTDEITLSKYGYSLIPKKFSFYAYEFIFKSNDLLLRSIWNSAKMTVVGAMVTTSVCLLYAYALSRKRLKARGILTAYLLFTMLFSGGLVPFFLVVSSLFDDSIWAIVLPGAMSAWYAILIRNFFLAVPDSLEEAARIDGASDIRVFLRIYLPISMPIIATIILFSAVGTWNNWFGPMLFITTKTKYPIQYLIQQLLYDINNIYAGGNIQGGSGSVVPSESIKMASVALASIPIIMVYPFLQRYFINGIILGSVKE